MNHGSIDLTTEEIERLVAEVWDVAAKEALAKGLPVTGYHDGRLFRYHPGKGIEDLARPSCDSESRAIDVGCESQGREPAASEEVRSDDGKLGASALAAAAFGEAPAEPDTAGQSQAVRHHDETAKLQEAAAAASPSLNDYTVQTIEYARHNANAALAFTAKLFSAKTFAEVVVLSTAHFCTQLATFSSQGDHRAAGSPEHGD